jgi:16S rRNA C1402 N4-methylase RsmH
MSDYHEPVMGSEILELFAPEGSGFYLDGTVGGGGHTRLLLDACSESRVMAVDRDPEALRASTTPPMILRYVIVAWTAPCSTWV